MSFSKWYHDIDKINKYYNDLLVKTRLLMVKLNQSYSDIMMMPVSKSDDLLQKELQMEEMKQRELNKLLDKNSDTTYSNNMK